MEDDINPPKWFIEGRNKINVSLIETQRIMTVKEAGSDTYISSVQRCSEQLIKLIGNAVKQSVKVSTILDSSYPNRLIKKLRQGTKDTFEELNNALAKLDERRKLLSSTGLTVNLNDSDLLQINEKQKDLINLLKLYIDDSHKKLEPFEDLSEKIALFKYVVLIDEPELSLHISWQNKFIKDLQSINSMNGVTVIIATHSPDIRDENWDLKVELKGLE